ncbi:hypothetical protein MSG28_010722 [Choristoneura fumiferana]|uniref:Uncharacterized protein n=1 Tax=Choristoneura fumiferana TaxID=7141 RepID=A0ACC0KP84_CHOFU|nr:hypothetical protein MSG28_010722 [Choristoneura fumiferana]
MAKFVLIICLALIGFVVAAPGAGACARSTRIATTILLANPAVKQQCLHCCFGVESKTAGVVRERRFYDGGYNLGGFGGFGGYGHGGHGGHGGQGLGGLIPHGSSQSFSKSSASSSSVSGGVGLG